MSINDTTKRELWQVPFCQSSVTSATSTTGKGWRRCPRCQIYGNGNTVRLITSHIWCQNSSWNQNKKESTSPSPDMQTTHEGQRIPIIEEYPEVQPKGPIALLTFYPTTFHIYTFCSIIFCLLTFCLVTFYCTHSSQSFFSCIRLVPSHTVSHHYFLSYILSHYSFQHTFGAIKFHQTRVSSFFFLKYTKE